MKRSRAHLLFCCVILAGLMISCNQVFVFKKTLSLNDKEFKVESKPGLKNDSLKVELILPAGEKFVLEREIDRKIYAAEIADLDANNVPEIYIYGKSNDGDEYGDVYSFTANNDGSLTEIFVPTLDPYISRGYMGHDKFDVSGSYLNRQFKVAQDVNSEGSQRVKYAISKSAVGLYLNEIKVLPPH